MERGRGRARALGRGQGGGGGSGAASGSGAGSGAGSASGSASGSGSGSGSASGSGYGSGHGSDHDHDHPHLHAPAHSHAPAHAHAPSPSPFPRSSATGKLLFLDAPSGLAGDMIIAALLDLGVPRLAVEEALAALPLAGFHIHHGHRAKHGVVGASFDVHVDGDQPGRTYGAIRQMLDASTLDPAVKARAQRTFLRLATAEARVHRTSLEDVHFHEVGGVDAIVDVVGSAAALEHLGAEEVVVSPLPMGRGFVKAAHGVIALPSPAAVECLAGFATYDAGIDFELVTPTGAAIVGAHAARSERWPSMVPERIGWGAGRADLADRPNLLRAVLGRPLSAATRAPSSDATHAVLEANVDDATGELVASWIESLLAAGALDVWATPITMKKGRPALTLSAIAPVDRADAIAHAMLRETTSLGVRRTDVTRTERPRRLVEVETPFGPIPVKIAEGPFGPPQIKPEFDACLAAARTHSVPVRQVLTAALLAASKLPAP